MGQVRAKQLRDLLVASSDVLTGADVDQVARKIEESDMWPFKGDKDRPPTVLQEAEKLIHGDRLKHYGHPEVNFKRIADGWSAFIGKEITPGQVACMMIILKVMRMSEGYHRDSVIDIGGYAALISILAEDDEL